MWCANKTTSTTSLQALQVLRNTLPNINFARVLHKESLAYLVKRANIVFKLILSKLVASWGTQLIDST